MGLERGVHELGDLGFRVRGWGPSLSGFGLRVYKVKGLGCRVTGVNPWGWKAYARTWGLGCRVWAYWLGSGQHEEQL